jgi:hypothetical protein
MYSFDGKRRVCHPRLGGIEDFVALLTGGGQDRLGGKHGVVEGRQLDGVLPQGGKREGGLGGTVVALRLDKVDELPEVFRLLGVAHTGNRNMLSRLIRPDAVETPPPLLSCAPPSLIRVSTDGSMLHDLQRRVGGTIPVAERPDRVNKQPEVRHVSAHLRFNA